MKRQYISFFILLLIIINSTPSYADLTNDISKITKQHYYSQRAVTVEYAKNNHNDSAITCIQFCYLIDDIIKEKGKQSEIWIVGGNHAIIVVIDNNKRFCYSNGKLTKENGYSKIRRIK